METFSIKETEKLLQTLFISVSKIKFSSDLMLERMIRYVTSLGLVPDFESMVAQTKTGKTYFKEMIQIFEETEQRIERLMTNTITSIKICSEKYMFEEEKIWLREIDNRHTEYAYKQFELSKLDGKVASSWIGRDKAIQVGAPSEFLRKKKRKVIFNLKRQNWIGLILN